MTSRIARSSYRAGMVRRFQSSRPQRSHRQGTQSGRAPCRPRSCPTGEPRRVAARRARALRVNATLRPMGRTSTVAPNLIAQRSRSERPARSHESPARSNIHERAARREVPTRAEMTALTANVRGTGRPPLTHVRRLRLREAGRRRPSPAARFWAVRRSRRTCGSCATTASPGRRGAERTY